MDKNLKILFITSEMAPYAKVGGLADVSAALPAVLKKRGHEVRVVVPLSRSVLKNAPSLSAVLSSMCVTMGQGEEWCAVHKAENDIGLEVLFIEHDKYFNREGLYHDSTMRDYPDNGYRFAFFSRAALQYCIDIGFSPDIVHVHDWQTSCVPAFLKIWFWNNPVLSRVASVLTIHNIFHQGVFSEKLYPYLGFGAGNFKPEKFEDFGNVNFLKGGIYFSDAVSTVSPSHAKEITEPFGGFGMAPFLSSKGVYFKGILNGADYSIWSPENDPNIPEKYSTGDLSGKSACKKDLQAMFKLDIDPGTCLIGTIGRFVHQKGFHLIRQIMEGLLNGMAVQFVILGEGDNELERFFGVLPERYPGRVGSFIGYDSLRAHIIEAGADLFLMPSIFEPCGLNQLYSLKYGTIPVVRATGGLDDTVEQYDQNTGEGTGFKFHDPTAQAMYNALSQAVSTYYDRPAHMQKLISTAMRKDFSWDRSVDEYEKLYLMAIEGKKEYDKRFA